MGHKDIVMGCPHLGLATVGPHAILEEQLIIAVSTVLNLWKTLSQKNQSCYSCKGSRCRVEKQEYFGNIMHLKTFEKYEGQNDK